MCLCVSVSPFAALLRAVASAPLLMMIFFFLKQPLFAHTVICTTVPLRLPPLFNQNNTYCQDIPPRGILYSLHPLIYASCSPPDFLLLSSFFPYVLSLPLANCRCFTSSLLAGTWPTFKKLSIRHYQSPCSHYYLLGLPALDQISLSLQIMSWL